jgi:hypothetical protein
MEPDPYSSAPMPINTYNDGELLLILTSRAQPMVKKMMDNTNGRKKHRRKLFCLFFPFPRLGKSQPT